MSKMPADAIPMYFDFLSVTLIAAKKTSKKVMCPQCGEPCDFRMEQENVFCDCVSCGYQYEKIIERNENE